MGTCPDLRFHISQVIIFHITPHHFYISQRCQAVQMWPLCTKMTLDSNSSQCSPIVGLFHSALPKSAHNLAQPSGKGLQTADNWLELELNGVLFATKNSLLSDNVVKCLSGGGLQHHQCNSGQLTQSIHVTKKLNTTIIIWWSGPTSQDIMVSIALLVVV